MDELTALARVEQAMLTLIQRMQSAFPQFSDAFPLYDVLAYHFGWKDQQLRPTSAHAGKRFRSLLCLRSCAAAGGDFEHAIAIASAIELLHNFTLIHDDIQDRSEMRRHRPTIWLLWGDAQAINAGDALFALSQLAALEAARSLELQRSWRLLEAFQETTLRIVEGQVLDLSFEQRSDVSVNEYLVMIERKTAALTAYASWAGAWVAGAEAKIAEYYRRLGIILGLGFQIRDDYLGVWGDPATTGKSRSDDIRRRKKTLPILLLLERVTEQERNWLKEIWLRYQELDETLVERVLGLLERHHVQACIQEMVQDYHQRARDLLVSLPGHDPTALRQMVEELPLRQS